MNYDAFMEPITWFLTGMEKHGAVPYRTIFNEDLENPPSEYYHNEI